MVNGKLLLSFTIQHSPFNIMSIMPVEDGTEFSQAILEEAKQEADEIVDLARREAERILDDAHGELEQIKAAEHSRTATQRAKMRYKQIIAAAELEARKQKILKQEALIAEVEKRVEQRLLQLRKEHQYPDLLKRVIRDGLRILEGQTFEVLAAPEDRAYITEEDLKRLGQEQDVSVTLADDALQDVSGVIVQRADKRVRCDNTFQRIFQRRKNEMRLLIAQELFEGREL